MTHVCPECFQNVGLRRRLIEVRPKYPDNRCDFHPRLKGIPIQAVSEIIDSVFRNNYDFGRYHPLLDEFMGEGLESILHDLTGADNEQVVRSLIDELVEGDKSWLPEGEDKFYQEDASYERSDGAFRSHGYMWAEFRRSIIHEQRFFNDAAKDLLHEIFDGIHRQRDTGKRQAIVVIEPGSADALIIRARIADESNVRKEIAEDVGVHMGSPPLRKRRPGRMNPSGICAFYGAYDLLTCISELRPTVGGVVVSAEFEITRSLVALDMTRFSGTPKEPNLFAKGHVKHMAQWHFMQNFMNEIAQPILPNDEHLDYIPTQAVAEYLLNHHKFYMGKNQRNVEAIIFESAQHPAGRNIVILGDACDLERPPINKNERLSGLGELFDTLSEGNEKGSARKAPGLRYRPDTLKFHLIREAEFRPAPFYDVEIEGDI
ncbi:hypothetical protein BH10PSE1_BH10PSE1_25830 [soil metagenome]